MNFTPFEISIVSVLINSTIAAVAISTLIYQRSHNARSLDFNFHPSFTVSEFDSKTNSTWTPKLCESADSLSKHFCADDHWFDISNDSSGPAFEFKCFIINSRESIGDINDKHFDTRIISREALVRNDLLQYKIPIDSIPFRHYNKAALETLFLVIEYKTISLRSIYRQVIALNIYPISESSQISDWKGAVEISTPQVVSFKQIKWYQNSKRLLIKDLRKLIEQN